MSEYTGIIRGSKLPYEHIKAQYLNIVDESRSGADHPLHQDNTEYTYNRWLRETSNLTGSKKKYNAIVSIDVAELIESLASENVRDFHEASQKWKRSMQDVVSNRAYAYASNHNVDVRTVIEVLNSLYSVFVTEPFYSILESNYTYGSRINWLRNLLQDRFGAVNYSNPRATWIGHYETISSGNADSEDYSQTEISSVLRNHIQYQMYPKQWDTLPLRYIGIPMVTDNYISYALPGNGSELSYDSIYYKSATAKSWFSAKRGYWYGRSRSGQVFDNYSGNWISKERWSNNRKYASCNLCHHKYDVMMLDWYKVRSYQNNRSRICYQCIATYGLSYNPWQKSWIIASYNNTEDMEIAANDRPIRLRHVDDTGERPVGRRDYDWRVDEEFLEDNNIDIDVNDLKLPIETRRYLTWLRKLPMSARMNIGFTLTTLRKDAITSQMTSNSSERVEFMDRFSPILDAFPAQYRSDDLRGDHIAMWIDSMMEDRDFRMRYSSRVAESRVTDDGWLEPSHGIRLNKEKNAYSYRPDFYYVDYIDGKYYSTYTEGSSGDYAYCSEHDVPNHRCTSWHREYGLFMGLELELIARDKREQSNVGPMQLFQRTLETFHPNDYRKMSHDVAPQLMYIKRDGSLPESTGAEFISQPMSMRAWQNAPKTFWYMTEQNYKAHSVGGVGIHIHIPWDAFTEQHGYTFLSALQALQWNANGLLRYIAQRPSNSWTSWDQLEYHDVPNAIAAVVRSRRANNSSKYQGINLMHNNTIELRYFNSNAKGNRVLKNLEFVQALYDFTMWKSDSSGWDNELGPDESLLNEISTWRNQADEWSDAEENLIRNTHDEGFDGVLNIEQAFVQFIQDNHHKYQHLMEFLLRNDDELEISQDEIDSLWEQPEEETTEEEVEEVVETVQPVTRLGNTI